MLVFLSNGRPPRSTRTDSPFPYTPLVRARRPGIGRIDLQDRRNLAGEGVRARLQHAERRGIGRKAGVDRELIVVMRIIGRSEEHTSELQSLLRISYAVFCLTHKQQRATT